MKNGGRRALAPLLEATRTWVLRARFESALLPAFTPSKQLPGNDAHARSHPLAKQGKKVSPQLPPRSQSPRAGGTHPRTQPKTNPGLNPGLPGDSHKQREASCVCSSLPTPLTLSGSRVLPFIESVKHRCGGVSPQQCNSFLWWPPATLPVSSIPTLSTWKYHQTPQVKTTPRFRI